MPKFGELFSLTLLLKLCFHKELKDSLTHKKLVLNTNYSQLIETASLYTFVSNQLKKLAYTVMTLKKF